MSKEKLTVESVAEKIIWNEIVTGSSGTKDNTKSAQILIKVFLEQIKDEIDNVFNKYLNEKGGNNDSSNNIMGID